jgi:hypothetical protein
MTAYQPDEGSSGPFPTYENGDIFLAWGELGTRAYSRYKPAIAVRIVKNVIDKYNQDGLAFQRYLRKSQTGSGGDILSNMASPIVGLYRNIYGIQPKWNRLYVEPHLTPELSGTRLKYWLRDQTYLVDLKTEDYGISAGDFAIRDTKPFAADVKQDTLSYFSGGRKTPSMTVTRLIRKPLEVRIETWPVDGAGARKWTESCGKTNVTVRHVVADLSPGTEWRLSRDGKPTETLRSDAEGKIVFTQSGDFAKPTVFEMTPAPK